MAERGAVRILLITGAVAMGVTVGRTSVSDGLLSRSNASKLRIAKYSGGALGADDVREALGGMTDQVQRRAAVEQLVRARGSSRRRARRRGCT